MISEVIHFSGFALTGGLLTVWAVTEFGSKNEDMAESDVLVNFALGCVKLYDRTVYYVKGLFGLTELEVSEDNPIEEKPTEKSPGEYELFL